MSYFAGDGQQRRRWPRPPIAAFLDGDIGAALAGEDAADRARTAHAPRDADHVGLFVDLALASRGVAVGEVGRAAHHGHGKARGLDRLGDGVDVGIVQRGEETDIHLQPVCAQFFGHLDPVEDGHGAVERDVVEIAFGKSGNSHRRLARVRGLR